MLQVALAQLRVHARRFIAVGLAVMLGVAFVSAALTVGATTKATLGASIGASYAKADLVVSGPEGLGVPPAAVGTFEALPEVTAVYGLERAYAQLTTGSRTSSAALTSTAPGELDTAEVTQGSAPSGPNEVALDSASAARLEVAPGDTVAIDAGGPSTDPAGALTVTGLTAPSPDPNLADTVQVLAPASLVRAATGGDTIVRHIQLAVAPDADPAAVAAAASAALNDLPADQREGVIVRTAAEQTTADVASLSNGDDILTAILLAFAAVSVLVAGLVISNTFSVLVAQRTRELALLRTIGAERRQIRRSVLIEAGVVGLVASALGVLLAVGVLAVLVGLARRTDVGSVAVLAVPPSAVVAGLAVGVLMTLIAAVVPARAATRVAPLAALRPSGPADAKSRGGKVRLAAGLLAVVAGGGLLALGASSAGLVPAVAGGGLSFLGVVLLAPFFVPFSVAAVGRLARPLGVAGQLASLNAVRNPARTTASSSALIVGVTLVTMMIVGAQTARTSFDAELAENFAVDVEVSGLGASGAAGRTPGGTADAQTLLGVEGVKSAVELTPVVLTSDADGGRLVYAADPEELAAVLRSQDTVLTDGIVLAPQTLQQPEITLKGANGPTTLPVTATDSTFFVPLITEATAERLGGTPPDALDAFIGGTGESSGQAAANGTLADYLGTTFWLQLDDGLDGPAVSKVKSQLAAVTGVPEYQVSGSAIERVAYNEIIDLLLLIVTALLAVAVLIALIGVANTLSLSVLERRRENSLLRALGLTKAQLRGMLAVEAVLIAGVAALLGTVLGIGYGVLGAQSALRELATVQLSLPVGQIAAVLAVAVAAGLLASVLPARRAARLSPVAGLAAD
ncbi:ABC transporter permease [Arthrobacter sp. MSA 4-2]|uniref:ABC transporter permease n=1 Tax=Arthrobacter sp. MSA 4-2 TaxID=2794349 RepID=UPI0018E7075F|nr:ABC transporter permease [Arthrobacter sp. MSA 4-2]MBJ2121722.1 ABC transporter permease [Arthrobacter sp. MSA 4-2]